MTVLVQELSAGAETQYTELVNGVSTSLLYHTLQYRDFLRSVLTGSKDRYLVAYENGRLVAALPAFIKYGIYGAVVNSLPFFGSNGAVVAAAGTGAAVKTALLEAYDEMCRAEKAVTSTIISNPLSADPDVFKEYPATFQDLRIGQFTELPAVPAGESLEDRLMSSFHPKTRNLVRKGLKSGYEIEHSDSDQALRRLQGLHEVNMRALNGPVKTWEICQALRRTFQYDRDYRVYTARKNGEIRAALLVLFHNRIVEYYIPAIQEEYRSEQPLSSLIFTAMGDAVKRGFRWWNWGGTRPALDGVYHFKSRWGTQDLNYRLYIKQHADVSHLKSIPPAEISRQYPYFYVIPFNAPAAVS